MTTTADHNHRARPAPEFNLNRKPAGTCWCETCQQLKPIGRQKGHKGWLCNDCKTKAPNHG